MRPLVANAGAICPNKISGELSIYRRKTGPPSPWTKSNLAPRLRGRQKLADTAVAFLLCNLRSIVSRDRRNWRFHFFLFVAGFLVLSTALQAATLKASLDRDTITFGESATLTLTFEGGEPQTGPDLPAVPNLQIASLGTSRQMTFINGQSSSTVSFNFRVMANQPGDYTIPAITTSVGNEKLASQPLSLKVLKPTAPPAAALNSGTQLAFLKLTLPKKELYVGETVMAQLDLYVNNRVQKIAGFQMTSFTADGFNTGKLVQGQNRQVQIGNAVYSVVPLYFSLRATKPGALSMGPLTAEAVLELATPGRQRDFMDPWGIFSRGEQRQVPLATEPQPVQVLPLPRENAPATFNGAVGSYTMTMTAGPTNIAVGEPITVKIQISGRGWPDSLTLPEQTEWRDFNTYPPTSKVDLKDSLGIQGTKSFELVVAPQHIETKALPPFSFSFFDPDQKAFRTLTQPAVPLVVRPGGSAVAPTAVTTIRNGQDNPPPSQDIVPNKQRLGSVAQIGLPLVQQRWFLALQTVPVLAFVSSVLWRRRADKLANNPRLRRQRQVARVIRDGLGQLRKFAAANKSEEFFALLMRLLQEQLGEGLDLPASAITEAVIEERLRPLGVPETTLGPLQELFQTCNLARYAPIKTSQELAALVPKLEGVLAELRTVKA